MNVRLRPVRPASMAFQRVPPVQSSNPKVSTNADSGAQAETPMPWWRYKILWLVVGGPLAVVIASTATAVVAIRGADLVLPVEDPQAPQLTKGAPEALTPAIEARNHAATAKP